MIEIISPASQVAVNEVGLDVKKNHKRAWDQRYQTISHTISFYRKKKKTSTSMVVVKGYHSLPSLR